MKNIFLFTIMCVGLFLVSCEKDDDVACQHCHIALEECCGATEPHAPGEHEVEIGQFCGDDLTDVEANGWVATEAIMHDGEEEFAVGDLVPATMIHCEEHAGDHDGHDHD